MKHLILTTLACLIPGTALAMPTFLPNRDVSVRYSLTTPGQPAQTLQLSYNAAQELARISSEYGYYVLANLPAGQAQLVIPALHAIVQAPDFSALAAELFAAGNKAHFTSLGKGHYAGLSCEMYQVSDQTGTARACLTPDGVTLYFSGQDAHGNADVIATSVTYAPQAAGQFTPPAGLTPLNLPPGVLKSLLAPN